MNSSIVEVGVGLVLVYKAHTPRPNASGFLPRKPAAGIDLIFNPARSTRVCSIPPRLPTQRISRSLSCCASSWTTARAG